MSWVKNKKTGKGLWRKWKDGQWYTVSPRQLREYFQDASIPDDKEGSWTKANLWWQQKEMALENANKPPPPRPLTEAEQFAFRAMHLTPPEFWPEGEPSVGEQQIKGIMHAFLMAMAGLHGPAMQHLLAGHPLPQEMLETIPAGRIPLLEAAVPVVRTGPVAAPPDKTVAAHAEAWLKRQQTLAEAGQMTSARVSNNRTCLAHFTAFLGPQSDVAGINAQKLEAFYMYVVARIRRNGQPEGWSVAYAKDVFSVARSFIRWAWEQGACDLPKNIKSPFKFGSPSKRVTTWTPIEFMRVVDEAPGKLKLGLLLMANCGMTQKDVSDLADEEVDWTAGRITRKRSKTKDEPNVPTLSFRLWPTTWELLQKYRSGTERVLLTESKLPYVREWIGEDGKFSKADGFASNYAHLKRRLKFNRPLKQLRKLGASLLAKHEVYGRFVSYFLGHSPRSVADKHYVVPPQDLFDQAVLWLGKQLGQVQ
jgi:integrase